MSAEAERAALNALAPQNGMAGAQILIDTVRTNPAAFSQADSPLGDFARALLAAPPPAAASLAIVPFVAAAPPPPPGQSASSAVPVDVSKLSEHKYYKPLGPEVHPDAPASHKFSHLRVDHTISGFAVGSEEEKAVRYIYIHLQYETKSLPCAEVPESHGGGRPAGARGRPSRHRR